MDETIFADIEEYCKQFETGAYTTLADKYTHFLWKESQRFRQIIEGRDERIIGLLRENGQLRRDLGKK